MAKIVINAAMALRNANPVKFNAILRSFISWV
jgi:hypothetical protein